MQERLLSPRVLHFERRHIIYEYPSVRQQALVKPKPPPTTSTWSGIVAGYSVTELSFSSDKLVVSSGIVAVAGAWRPSECYETRDDQNVYTITAV